MVSIHINKVRGFEIIHIIISVEIDVSKIFVIG